MKHRTLTLFLLHQPVVIGWFCFGLVQAGVFALRAPLVFVGAKLAYNGHWYET